MEKYTYQDWFEGKFNVEELFEELRKSYSEGLTNVDYDILSDDEYEAIRNKQCSIYLEIITTHLWIETSTFLDRYCESFVRELTLKEKISQIKDEIEIFKNEYPIEFAETLDGKDGRFDVTPELINQCKNWMDNWNFPEPINKHMELIIKFKFLEWLLWAEKTDNKGLIEDYHTYYKTQNENYKWPVYREGKRLRQLIEKPQRPLKENPLSYSWLVKPETELLLLYQLLIEKKLIHPNTTEEQLKAVFTEQPLQEIEPIKWNEAKNLLAYFLDSIHNKSKIPKNTNVWSIAEKCFSNGYDLIQARTNYEGNKNKKHPGKPKNYQMIDSIITALQ